MSESNETTSFEEFLGTEYQKKLFWQILTDVEFAEKVIPLLGIEYFDDNTYKRLYMFIKKYFTDNEKPPNLYNESIYTAIKKQKRDSIEEEQLLAVVDSIKKWDDRIINNNLTNDGDIVQKETLNFIKQQEYRKLALFIENSVKSGQSNTDNTLGEIEEKIKYIGNIGDDDDYGVGIMDDFERVLTEEFRHTIPTGIEGIDKLMGGGLAKGEMGIILAPSGVGKSTALTKIANTAYNIGKNVLQIVFEDTEDQIRRKHFTIWASKLMWENHEKYRDNKKDIPMIKLSNFSKNTEYIKEKILEFHKNNEETLKRNKLVIKRFSQENTTIPKIKAYIDNYQKRFNIKFDIVVLDYLDCVESHRKTSDKTQSEIDVVKSFEGMTIDYGIPCWTAVQTNRSGLGADRVGAQQTSGSIARVFKAHFLMSVAKTQEQKQDGLATLEILKARFAQDGQVFSDTIFDNDSMEIKITDPIYMPEEKTVDIPEPSAEEKQEFNNRFDKDKIDKLLEDD